MIEDGEIKRLEMAEGGNLPGQGHSSSSVCRCRGFSALILILMTVLAYLPVLRAGWIWDDDYYVTQNINLRSFDGLRDLWMKLGAVPQYYPVTHTTFWVEYHLWGLRPAGYHAVNLLLHAASVVMLWIILRRLGLPGAWLAAAVFAVHPVHVESVAWVTERKNVLSAFFYLSAANVYFWGCGAWRKRNLVSLDKSSDSDDSLSPPAMKSGRYLLVILLFALALLSKSVTASLPAAILLIIWWKHGRISWRDVAPLLPMILMGLAMGRLTAYMERVHVGAQGLEWDFSVAQRILIAGRAVWFYAWKLSWPTNLAFIYPRWKVAPQQIWQWLFPVTAAGLVITAVLLRRRIGRGPAVGILFFGGTLIPALGFVNLLPMRYSFVADHFQYLASIGLIAIFAVAVMRIPQRIRVALVSIILLVLMTLTFRRTLAYADLPTLWRDTIAKNPDGWMPRNNYANLLMAEGRLDEAEVQLAAALQSAPNSPEVLINLGSLAERRGRLAEAIDKNRQSLAIRDGVVARTNLGRLLAGQGSPAEGLNEIQKAIELNPKYAPAYRELGVILQAQSRSDDAMGAFNEAIRIDPGLISARVDLGVALLRAGRLEDAGRVLDEAIALAPESATAHNSRGLLLATQQQFDAAQHEFREAIRLDPTLAEAFNNLGATLENAGDIAGAVAAYRRALELKPSFAAAGRNLDRATKKLDGSGGR